MRGLSTLLFMTNGVTSTLQVSTGSYFLGSAPSAGALYPTISYVLVEDVEGLIPGLYHYAVKEHALHRISDSGDLVREFGDAVPRGEFIENAAVTFFFTSMFYRSSWKYQERAYRYCGLDAGHLAIHTSLSASALGYAYRFIGRFDDSRVNELLGVDETQEGSMLIMPIASRGSQLADGTGQQTQFLSTPTELASEQHPLLHLIHGRTYLARGAGDQRRQGYLASLSQDAVGNAQANVILTVEPERMGYPDGDGGYRYALLDSGMLAGRLYLHTTALGLGTCGIGAYFDDEISELIDVFPKDELVIYMAAIGVREG